MIKVNEIFGPTIQGEGKSAGMKVSFLRLSLCNLQCVWCDTPYTWNWEGTNFQHDSPTKYSRKKEIHQMSAVEVFNKLESLGMRNIVISGGEPLIQHKQLLPLLQLLRKYGYWVEVETNGTIYPSQDFVELIDQFNCSPKLENSNNDRKSREHSEVLTQFAQSSKTTFKFVVSKKEDIKEILYLTYRYKMKQVYLMPLGMTVAELNQTRDQTIALSKQTGFIFSDRLHVVQLGGGRGV